MEETEAATILGEYQGDPTMPGPSTASRLRPSQVFETNQWERVIPTDRTDYHGLRGSSTEGRATVATASAIKWETAREVVQAQFLAAVESARLSRIRAANVILLFVLIELFAWLAFKGLRSFALSVSGEVLPLFHPYLLLLGGLAAFCLSLTVARALYDYVRPDV